VSSAIEASVIFDADDEGVALATAATQAGDSCATATTAQLMDEMHDEPRA
jgi:hypothetical protein